jgi:hypothetical protein
MEHVKNIAIGASYGLIFGLGWILCLWLDHQIVLPH